MASIAGVDGQVHDDLLEHAGVSLDGGEAGRVLGGDGHILAEQPGEHVGEIAQDGVKIEDAELRHLLCG